MYGLQFKNEYPEPIARELEQLVSFLDGWLHQEHNEDGTHNFPDFTEGETSVPDAIQQIIERYQAGGQNWFWGPWLFNKASDPRARRAWLRPPNPAAGTYNDYSPVGIDYACVLELEPDGDITITGLKAREGLNENRLLVIRNRDSAFTITITHEGLGSIASNRFDLNGDVPVVIGPRQTLWTLYDTGRDRWAAVVTGQLSGGILPGSGAGSVLRAQMEITIDGGGSVITTGAKAVYTRVPWAFTVTGWDIVSDVSTSAVIDLWKDTYANFPPTNADTITGTDKPTLSAGVKATSSALTGWDTSWVEGERVEAEVESNNNATKIVVTVYGTRST